MTVICVHSVIDQTQTRSAEYTEWQRAHSGVHSIMMEKSAQAVGDGACIPNPLFTISTITYKVVANASAEDSLFPFYPCMHSVVVALAIYIIL